MAPVSSFPLQPTHLQRIQSPLTISKPTSEVSFTISSSRCSDTLTGPFISMDALTKLRDTTYSFGMQSLLLEETPSLADSETSSLSGYESDDSYKIIPARLPLQWKFYGLTLWVEYEEFNADLTKAIDHAVRVYGTERIPVAHSTIAYGMMHLSKDEAKEKLQQIPHILPDGYWPMMGAPRGVTQDIAKVGRPGQVADIAWAELSLSSNSQHEGAIDAVYTLFNVPTPRSGPWTPHISLAYDNPDDSVLNLRDTFDYVRGHPTLLRPRNVKAISLWDTNGKMADWRCVDRVYLNE